MLRRLEIRGLVVIEHAELDLGPGLTAITGETGAGKTVLTSALALLAGASADSGMVRPGHKHALVQATLALPDGFWDALPDDDPARTLRDVVDDESEVIVSRRIPAEGRARSMIDGQAATTDAVASLVRHRIRFSGQGEQRRLTSSAAQLRILDRFAGPEAIRLDQRLTALRRDLRAAERAVAEAEERRAEAARRREELEALVADVDAVAPDPAEHVTLTTERERLRHASRLGEAAGTASQALSPSDGSGAIELAGEAERALASAASIDPTLAERVTELNAAQAALQEISLSLSGYLASLEAEPGRLDVVEERLGEYARIDRRYGPGVEAVLTAAEQARADLDSLAHGEAGDAELQTRLAEVRDQATKVADELHAVRAEAAPRLAEGVGAELADLAMPNAVMRVELTRSDDTVPRDRCVFMLRVNPGLPEAPIADAASGGELSRVLLALHGLAASGDDGTWVFDEVDAGIGGTTATAVARRLAALGEDVQTIVITHLPQVAAAGGAHFRLVKSQDAELSATSIEPLKGDEVRDELVRMLGAEPGDEGAVRHAEELLGAR
ncbi:MAG: AAA family ATPase [Thermoleophilia bacterium]